MVKNMKKNNNNEIEYESPEILMIDFENSVVDNLKKDGFNIETGTFGKKYKILENNVRKVCITNENIPNIIEKDVIIIDMKQHETEEVYKLNNVYDVIDDGVYVISKEGQKIFNPINIAAYMYKEMFIKLKNKNCIFIIFANAEINQKYNIMTQEDDFQRYDTDDISNYDFLPFDIGITENYIDTKKYSIVAEGIFNEIFKNYKGNICATCTFDINSAYKNNTARLLENIYGNLIGYIQLFEDNNVNNMLIVLPQCTNKDLLLKNIFENVLPYFYPEMFKDFVKDTWINKEEYLLPEIKEILDEKNRIQEEYQIKIEEIEKKLDEEKEKNQFLYNIISSSGTGKKLVDNVIKCLEFLGYPKVEDYDDVREDGDKEEDLHIYLNEKDYMIAEVKGVNGPAIEDDCNVIVKYKSRNCAKIGVSSIHGMVFVNYHKNVEPNKREELGFTPKEIKDAKRDGYTLVGTYELFKALKLCKENIINKKTIRKSLETPGLFKSIPEEFENIGKIDNLLSDLNVICLPLGCDEININDELLIIDGTRCYKTKIESMMVDSKNVKNVKKGDRVGIKIKEKIPQFKSSQIYLIKNKGEYNEI